MSYAMCLDSSWDVICEEEMYNVNGGWSVFDTVCTVVAVHAIACVVAASIAQVRPTLILFRSVIIYINTIILVSNAIVAAASHGLAIYGGTR